MLRLCTFFMNEYENILRNILINRESLHHSLTTKFQHYPSINFVLCISSNLYLPPSSVHPLCHTHSILYNKIAHIAVAPLSQSQVNIWGHHKAPPFFMKLYTNRNPIVAWTGLAITRLDYCWSKKDVNCTVKRGERCSVKSQKDVVFLGGIMVRSKLNLYMLWIIFMCWWQRSELKFM